MTRKCEHCEQLKEHNFRVNSNGWIKKTDPNGVECLENPKGDAWEYLKCERIPDILVGEQLFTWDAAKREMARTGKRILNNDEWSRLVITKADVPNLIFPGYRSTNGSFLGYGTGAYFWSELEKESGAWFRYLNSGNAMVFRSTLTKASGFSLRCTED